MFNLPFGKKTTDSFIYIIHKFQIANDIYSKAAIQAVKKGAAPYTRWPG